VWSAHTPVATRPAMAKAEPTDAASPAVPSAMPALRPDSTKNPPSATALADPKAADAATRINARSRPPVGLLLLFFLLGKRAGKKKTTFVEIRRV